MTISISIIGKNSIVMASDSREMHILEDEKERGVLYDDSRKKIFILPNKSVLSFAGTSGRGYIINKKHVLYRYADVNEVVYSLFYNKNTKKMDINCIVKYLNDQFKHNYREYTTEIMVGGIVNDELGVFILNTEDIRNGVCEECINEAGDFYFIGCHTEEAVSYMKSLFHENQSLDDNEFAKRYLAKLTKRELISLSYKIVHHMIDYSSKMEEDKRFIGGHVDIALINKNKSRWIRRYGKWYPYLSTIISFNITKS